MREAIEQRGDAGGVGKNLVPFLERAVGSDHYRPLLVPAVNNLVEKVRGIVVIGKICELVHAEQMRAGIGLDPAPPQLWGVALQVLDELCGGAKQDGVSGHHSRIGDVFGDHGLAQAVTAQQDQIAFFLDEIQGEGAFNHIALDFLGPVPIEVGDGFETTDARCSRLRRARSRLSI